MAASYLDPDPEATGETGAPGPGRDLAAEPSYYEIALTSRQVLIGFVILLTSVVVAFFAGVWVGKSGSPATPPRQVARAETRPGAARPARPGAAREATGGEAAARKEPEEFQFFAEEAKGGAKPAAPTPADPPAAVAPSPAGTTLIEDLGGKSATPSAATPTSPTAAPAPTVKPAAPLPAAPPPAAPGPAAPKPAAVKPATPLPATVSAPAKPATAAATPVPAGSPIIQVFSSSDEAQARRVLAQLTQAGFKAFISPIVKDGATMHRVRVGPFRSDADAKKVAEAIKKKLKLDTWITR
jgi:cell division septation protein DedD